MKSGVSDEIELNDVVSIVRRMVSGMARRVRTKYPDQLQSTNRGGGTMYQNLVNGLASQLTLATTKNNCSHCDQAKAQRTGLGNGDG